MTKITLYLPTELHHALRELSRRMGRPQADVVREALHLYIGQQNRPPLRSLGLGEDAELHGAQTEDWLEEGRLLESAVSTLRAAWGTRR